MAHLVGDTHLFHGSHGVTAADDRAAALGAQVGQGVGDAVGAGGELVELEHAHGAVPDHGLAVGQGFLEGLERIGADIQTHPAIGDGVDAHGLAIGIGGEVVGQHHVAGQQQLHTLGRGLGLQFLSQLQLVLFHQALAHRQAPGFVEGEDHAAADQHLVALVDQGFQHADLAAHLGTAHDRRQGALGLVDGALQVLELLLHQVAGHAGAQELGNALGGGMGAVGGAKGVVHIDIRQAGQLLSEAGIVLFLLREEAHVFEQHHVAFSGGGHLGLGVGADAAVGFDHRLAQQLAEAGGHGGEAHGLVHLALGPPEVGRQQHLGALADQVVDGGQGGADAGVVGDRAVVVERYVEVHPHQHALAAQVIGGEAGQGSLRHGTRA